MDFLQGAILRELEDISDTLSSAGMEYSTDDDLIALESLDPIK